jgi:HEAT repeat protein
MKRAWVVAVGFLALASGSALLSRWSSSSPGHLTPTSPPNANRSWINETPSPARHSVISPPTEFDPLVEAFETDPQRGLAAMASLLSAGNLQARRRAIHALHGSHEPAALAALAQALGDDDSEIRWAALRAVTDLAFRGHEAPDVTTLLELALSDPDPALRAEAVDALAQRGAEGSRGLEQALSDAAEEVRGRAAALIETAQR